MAIPITGEVSLSQIRSELGATGQISFSQLYRGGQRFPYWTRCKDGWLTESGNVSFSNLRGAQRGKSVQLGGTCSGGGNCYHYELVYSHADYIVATGDRLLYSVKAITVPPGAAALNFGVDLSFVNSSDSLVATLRDYVIPGGTKIKDNNGFFAHPGEGYPLYYGNQWCNRWFDLSPFAGLKIDDVSVVLEHDQVGDAVAQFSKIMITDGSWNFKTAFMEDQLPYQMLGTPSSGGSLGYSNISKLLVDYVP